MSIPHLSFFSDGLSSDGSEITPSSQVFVNTDATFEVASKMLVGVRGLEPRTSASQTRRATNCATPRKQTPV